MSPGTPGHSSPAPAGAERSAAPFTLGGHQRKISSPSPGVSDEFGYAVAGGGDINGDGFDDLLIGAHLDDDVGLDAGAAFVFWGSEDGVDEGLAHTLVADDGAELDDYGAAVAIVGDMDGDGLAEFAVGAPRHDAVGAQGGAVYLYAGGDPPAALDKLTLGSAGSLFGTAVAAAGDVDGDGLADVVMAAPSQGSTGSAWVVGGGDASLLSVLTANDAADDDDLGQSVAGGDLDGDGYSDVVLGAPGDDGAATDGGAVYVFAGSSDGPSVIDQLQLHASDGQESDGYGWSVAVVPDLDGDGFSDLAVGAYLVDDAVSDEGAVYVYPGGASGVQVDREQRINAPGAVSSAFFGVSVAGVGDIDGDGFGDLLVGASGAEFEAITAGAAYLYLGSAEGIATAAVEQLSVPDPSAGFRYGRSISAAGDVDGDSRPDFVAGAHRYARVAGDSAGDTAAGDTGAEDSPTGAAWLVLPGCRDKDEDGVCVEDDCDDQDPDTFPGAAWLDSTTACMRDRDGDGYGDQDVDAEVSAGSDCDDLDAAVNPEGTERCDGRDDDCNGLIDDDALGASLFAPDADGDLWTDDAAAELACDAPADMIASTFLSDCDDSDPSVNPGAVEIVADGIDQDCSGADLVEAVPAEGKGCSAVSGVASSVWLLALGLLARRRRVGPQ